MRGQSKVNMYPQPEGTLGEHMLKNGRDLGDDNSYGKWDQSSLAQWSHDMNQNL